MKVSAGLLMYKILGMKILVFLVHPGGPFWKSKDKGAWSIPKGEIEDNKNLFDVAKKEFIEETGIKTDISEGGSIYLGEVRQKSGKIVHCWAFEGDFMGKINCKSFVKMNFGEEIIEFPEVDKGEFFDIKKAEEKINPAQFEFIKKLTDKLGLKKFEKQGKLF